MSSHSTRFPKGKLTGSWKTILQAALEPNMSLPGVVAVIIFLGSDKAQVVNESARSIFPDYALGQVVTALVTGLYVFGSLSAVTLLRLKFLGKLDVAASFLLSIVLATTSTVFLVEITLGPNLAIAVSNWVRLLFVTFFLAVLVGNYRKWVASELFKSLGLLEKLEQQRDLLIEADEKARREIADLLHDSVQSKLVVVATKLHQISSKASPKVAADLEPMLLDLENLRSLDVRNASRALSPDLGVAGLNACLDDLAFAYAETMNVEFQVEGLSKQAETRFGLAIYRICEQSFLNALKHGKAKRCIVKLRKAGGWLDLEIDNDGLALPSETQPAQGTAIIAAWVSKFGGAWSLSNLDNGNVRLAAKLSLKQN